MEMEFMAEFTEGMSRDRARQIIKGKRTKRHRPCSPPFGNMSSSTSDNCFIDNTQMSSSEISTKEDEDMANCLIMLAQSASTPERSDQIRQKTDRLSSRRFTEMTLSGGYECKTCNRTFPSFQALGGHRASHKKPKLNVEDKKSSNIPPPLIEYVEDDHDQHHTAAVAEDEENKAITSNLHTGIINNSNTKSKVHECSICGSEFLSGQALGGHMRKHRPVPVTVNRTVISMNTEETSTAADDDKSPGGLLSLDLNFPPPEVVEDHRLSKFPFTGGSSSQQHLVFSAAPAFVDCHY